MESALDTEQGMEDLSFWSFPWEMQMVHQSSVQLQPCAFVSMWLHALPPSCQFGQCLVQSKEDPLTSGGIGGPHCSWVHSELLSSRPGPSDELQPPGTGVAGHGFQHPRDGPCWGQHLECCMMSWLHFTLRDSGHTSCAL